MPTFWKIAWRDLWRHRLRSSLTLGAIVFGTAMTLFVMAFARGEHVQMIRTAIGFFPGYLQIHRTGQLAEPTLGRSMPVKPELTAYLQSSRLVSGYSARLCTDSLVQAGSNLAGAKICGMVPENELKVSRVAQTFFPEMTKMPKGVKPVRRFRGQYLASADLGWALLGEELAKNLQIQVGDQFSILGQDFYGGIASQNFRVKGIFHAGSPEYDSGLMLVNLPELQTLLNMPGLATTVTVNVKDPRSVPELEKNLYELLSGEPGPWRIEPAGRPGFWRIQPLRPNLEPDSPLQLVDQEILQEALQRIPNLKGYSFQVKSELMLDRSRIAALGVIPEREKQVCPLFAEMREQAFGQDNWLMLRSDLANKLNLKPGQPVILTGSNYLGENFELELNLAGTFAPGPDAPDAYLALGPLQDKLRLGGNIQQALLSLPARMSESEALALIGSRLNYEVIPWQELIPGLVQLLTLDNIGAILWLMILLIVIAFVVLLTILMSVLERSHQFGIMKAIGTQPAEIFRIVCYESGFLGLVGTAIGLLVGTIPSLYFTYYPLVMASMTDYLEEMGFEPFLYAKLEFRMFPITALIIFTIVMVMTVFPALRASRIKPVQTLRLQ